MSDIPEDVMKAAREHCSNWGNMNVGDGAARMVAAAIRAGYVQGLEAAAAVIHCGCDSYCDIAEAEQKIRALIPEG